MVTCLRILVLNCMLISVVQGQAIDLFLDKLEDGLAIVTSREGDVRFNYPDGRSRQAELHAVEQLTGLDILTEKEEYLFLALSNGAALGIYENSDVQFESYLQQPFKAGAESKELEPTRSKLVLGLKNGSLTFSAETLSPLSEIVIQLPVGQVRMHKASGRVLYDHTGAHITILSGIVTFHYPESEAKDFINGPNRVRISEQSAKRAEIAESVDYGTDSARELTEELVRATSHSRERVLFRTVSTAPAIPQPVLIAKPETLDQASPRPYRYLD